MSDCPHVHIQDSGLQAFREIIREKTDGGRTIVEFLTDAAEGSLPGFEPEHRIQASEVLARYGFKVPANPVRQHDDPKPKPVLSRVEGPKRSSANTGASAPALKKPGDIDPAIDDFAQTIRDETKNGLTIVRNLIQIMEARERPYMPHHNLAAARRLIENGFPLTDALLCAPDCTHHAPAHPEPSPVVGQVEDQRTDEERWASIEAKLKRMEDEGILTPYPNAPPIDISGYRMPKDFDSTPYEKEEAEAFRAEIALQLERQRQRPEIEERRRKKLARMYPSHSDDVDEDSDPPDT